MTARRDRCERGINPSLACVLVCALACTLACEKQACDADCATTLGSASDTSTGATDTDDGTDTGTDTGTDDGTDDGTDTADPQPDPACLVDAPIVVIDTSMGTMVVQLDAVRAPTTVANFIDHVALGFYDGLIVHRVLDGFVIQSGWMEPGMIERPPPFDPIARELHPDLLHVDGAIAMARRNEPDTAQAQWYITDGAQPSLDGNYAVFGVMLDGFEVRNAISAVPTQTVTWMGFEIGDVPVEDVIVNSVECVESWP